MIQVGSLKPVEYDRCQKFVMEHGIDTHRFARLYEVAKRAPLGHFGADFTQYGASDEESRAVRQLFSEGLNFHQLELFLIAPRAGTK